MAKSVHGGGVDFPIRATTDQLRQDLEQGKQMVQQAAQQMRGTANVSLGAPTQLGPAVTTSTFDANVQAKMARMQDLAARRAEASRIATAARRGLGITTASEAAGLMGSRYGPSLSDMEALAAQEARAANRMAVAGRAAAMARGARFGLGVAGGAIAAGAMVHGSLLAQNRAFVEAGDRFSFLDRNRFNDSTIRAAAGGASIGEHPINRLLSVIPAFSDELQRAARAAGIMAEAHRSAVMAIQDARARQATASGRPIEALDIAQSRELAEARGKFDQARRNAFDTAANKPAGAAFWPSIREDYERRVAAANKTAREAKAAYDAIEATQNTERALALNMEDARRHGIMIGADMTELRGAEMVAQTRGDSIRSLAVRRRADRQAMDLEFENRLARTVRQDERDVIGREHQQAKANFNLETRLQLRQLGLSNVGESMGVAEGARFGASNALQFSMEERNLSRDAADALRELPGALRELTEAISNSPLIHGN